MHVASLRGSVKDTELYTCTTHKLYVLCTSIFIHVEVVNETYYTNHTGHSSLRTLQVGQVGPIQGAVGHRGAEVHV